MRISTGFQRVHTHAAGLKISGPKSEKGEDRMMGERIFPPKVIPSLFSVTFFTIYTYLPFILRSKLPFMRPDGPILKPY